MAKRGLDITTVQSVLRDNYDTKGWALCIGSGTSMPLLPDWYGLVDKMIENNCKIADRIDINEYKKMGFSADAMIQAVKNKLHLEDSEFIKVLSEELFAPLKNNMSIKEWNSYVKVHETNSLAGITSEEWKDFKKIKKNLLDNTSANLLASVVVESISKKIPPKSILTFNGEAIFLTLLNYYYWHSDRVDNSNKFDRVINGITTRYIKRIPYIHCHGVVPINGYKIRIGRNASDKLVFSEESYLQLANSSLSWQAISFIENCMQSKMVFIGLSLTDGNMRRWLSWIHTNKIEEFQNNGIKYKDSTEHFWINKKPKTEVEKIWVEETVAHLGVRLVWIDNWSQTGEILSKMLGV